VGLLDCDLSSTGAGLVGEGGKAYIDLKSDDF